MEFLYRTPSPAYRGCSPPPQQRNGLLAGFGCYLFGGGSAPAYRTLNGKNGSAVSGQRCWWQAFGATPQYKAAPSPSFEPVLSEPADSAGDDAGCDCDEEEDEASGDVPPEVYVWTE